MKDFEGADDSLSGSESARISALVDLSSDNFNALTIAAGLDPRSDFRFADLRGVDFSNCDLRGHDFTGADLRHSFGVGCTFDATTCFSDADVQGSLFSHTVSLSASLNDLPGWEREFRRLKDSDWSSIELWLGANINESSAQRRRAMRIAMKVFDSTDQPSVKSSIMFYSRFSFDTGREHKDFLIHTVSSKEQHKSVVLSALRVLASIYHNDPVVFEYFLILMRSPHFEQRNLALLGALNSKFFSSTREHLLTTMNGKANEPLRRYIVERMARRRGKEYEDACREPLGSQYLDYSTPISDSLVSKIAQAMLHREHARRQSRDRFKRQRLEELSSVQFSRSSIEYQEVLVRRFLGVLIQDGVPFRFLDDDPASLDRV